MGKYIKTTNISIKDRRIAFVSKKGMLLEIFDNLDEAVDFLIGNKIAYGSHITVSKMLYRAIQNDNESVYRFSVFAEGINGITKEYFDTLIKQKKEVKLQA